VTARETPLIAQLRRYARALAGPGAAHDALVRETLERAAHALPQCSEDRESRIALYTLMHQVYAEAGGQAAGAGRWHEFEQAIGALPREQREVFLLVTLEQMSYETVAATLGIPIGTVMSRLARAREKLRTLLRKPETRLRLAASNAANDKKP
jgi:DNA-directed RNA polymerase specialized sigma24 family protein